MSRRRCPGGRHKLEHRRLPTRNVQCVWCGVAFSGGSPAERTAVMKGLMIHVFSRDMIVKPILVLPEGFPVEATKSAFICPKDFSDDSTITWDLDLPDDLVPESATAHVFLIGDILGPALENLDNLVRLPMGCGEQNMILFVPNIHVIGYLDATRVENPGLRAKAIRNMEKGIHAFVSLISIHN